MPYINFLLIFGSAIILFISSFSLVRFEKEAEADAELTFRPQYSATASTFPEVRPVVTSLSHPERVLALAEIKRRAAEEQRMLEQMEREEREMRECTFRCVSAV
jgi:phytoene dehydrogenase-like protein